MALGLREKKRLWHERRSLNLVKWHSPGISVNCVRVAWKILCPNIAQIKGMVQANPL